MQLRLNLDMISAEDQEPPEWMDSTLRKEIVALMAATIVAAYNAEGVTSNDGKCLKSQDRKTTSGEESGHLSETVVGSSDR